MPNKELLLRFAWLKQDIAKAESEIDMIKPIVLEEIQKLRGESDSPIELTELPGYKFNIMKRKTWTYSDFIKQSEAALKERKKEEEANGEATYIETEHLTFNSPKDI